MMALDQVVMMGGVQESKRMLCREASAGEEGRIQELAPFLTTAES